ncbi:30S ribosomal protein S9 [Metamycoplasma sualvi]|uniref:30S ribosomal protein S9 n=1 Tax=Metamycoplasma sualvi TaxID=2125 RepID=UPI00387328CF
MKNTKFHGLGRRKSSSARVTIQSGTGKFLINKIEAKQYLKSDILIKDALQPFEILEQMNKWDVNVNVSGGGLSGQAGAIRLGIARALIEASEDYKPKLKKQKMLTRDARVKERKKPGLRKARRARQFSKR